MDDRQFRRDVDGNLYALEQYLSGEEEHERRYEDYLNELDETIGSLVDEIISHYTRINKQHDFPYQTLEQYIRSR